MGGWGDTCQARARLWGDTCLALLTRSGSRALANSPMRPGETSPQAVTSCSLAAIGAVRAACCAFLEQLTRCNEVWQQHHRASGFSRDHRWKLRGWMSFDREVRRTRGWIRALC